MPSIPDSNKNALTKITSQEDFDSIARTYHQNTPYSLPHTMFVIDRRAKNKVYFINSQRFRFHKDFLLVADTIAIVINERAEVRRMHEE